MMDFEIRTLTDQDKILITKWWNYFGHPGVPNDIYPELSLLVSYKGQPVCSGCSYLTDSYLMYFDNYISDPKSDDDIKDLALDILTKCLIEKARLKGYKYWAANAKQKCVADRTKKFKQTQYGEGHYWFTGEI